MDAPEILLVILASALAVFLVLGIILLVLLIKVARQIHAITKSAKATVDGVHSFVGTITKAAAPAVTSSFIIEQVQRVVDHYKSRPKSRKDKEE